MKWTSRSGWAL